jgi:hypothetical protein
MSVIVKTEGFEGVNGNVLVSKGAPEMIFSLLKD